MTVHFDSLNATDGVKAQPLLEAKPARLSWYGTFGKRSFDFLVVLLLLPILLPIMALLAALIWLSYGKPIYRQERIGQDGRVFTMLKFRTMVPDAEKMLAEYLERDPVARREWDENQKLRDDPRITRFGRVLRKTSMDELPQFLNVLKGDMAIVGPRPMLPEQRPLYPGVDYYSLRPGITGFWQISDRNDCSFSGRARHDTQYARAMSLGTDLSVVARTVGVVLRGTGC